MLAAEGRGASIDSPFGSPTSHPKVPGADRSNRSSRSCCSCSWGFPSGPSRGSVAPGAGTPRIVSWPRRPRASMPAWPACAAAPPLSRQPRSTRRPWRRPWRWPPRQRPRWSSRRPRPRDLVRSAPPSCRGPGPALRHRAPPASPSRTATTCGPARRRSCGARRWPWMPTSGGRRRCRAPAGGPRPTRAGACGATRPRRSSPSRSWASCFLVATSCVCPPDRHPPPPGSRPTSRTHRRRPPRRRSPSWIPPHCRTPPVLTTPTPGPTATPVPDRRRRRRPLTGPTAHPTAPPHQTADADAEAHAASDGVARAGLRL